MHELLTGPHRATIDVNWVTFDCTALPGLSSCYSHKHRDRATRIAEELLEIPEVNVNFQQPVTLYTPLHMAAMRNNAILCRLLSSHGADPDLKEAKHGMRALELAERFGCKDTVVAFRKFQEERDAAAGQSSRQTS